MILILVGLLLLKIDPSGANCPYPCPDYHHKVQTCEFYQNISCYNETALLRNDISGEIPGKARDVTITMLSNRVLRFTWRPDTATLPHLQGFLFNMSQLSGACEKQYTHVFRAFIYQNTTGIQQYKQAMLNLEVIKLCGKRWRINLLTLPSLECDRNRLYYILVLPPPLLSGEQSSSSEWESLLTVSYSFPMNTISVNFTKAPADFNFHSYKISLRSGNTVLESVVVKHTAEPFLTFHQAPGIYNITLQPTDMWPNDPQHCACRTRSDVCTACKATCTNAIHFTDPCPTPPPLTSPPSVSNPSDQNVFIYLMFLGIAAVITFLLFLRLYLRRRNKCELKRAILFSVNDHIPHDNAVTQLMEYLKDFGVIVHHADIFGQCIFEVFDVVVLVNSTALAKRQDAWKEGQDYKQFLREGHSRKLTNEAFLLIDQLSIGRHQNQVISLKFDHVPDSQVFKHYPSHSGNFSIPNNLSELVKNMISKPLNRRQAASKKKALLNAIKEAEKYEQYNKNWFTEKYGEPVPMSESLLIHHHHHHHHHHNKDIHYSINNNNNNNNPMSEIDVSELLFAINKGNDDTNTVKSTNLNYDKHSISFV